MLLQFTCSMTRDLPSEALSAVSDALNSTGESSFSLLSCDVFGPPMSSVTPSVATWIHVVVDPVTPDVPFQELLMAGQGHVPLLL